MTELTLLGEPFEIAAKVGLMPLMRFAHLAKSGLDSADMDGLAAIYDLLEQCVVEDEWVRFQAHATKVRADGEDLLGVVKAVMEELSKRPTSQPSVSSDGQAATSERSTDGSSVLDSLASRPDLQNVVKMAQQARSA